MLDPAALRARLDGVRDRIARAARRAGRDPASVRLIAVSKTFSADDVRAAAAAGQIDFGENKVQEAQRKIAETADLPLRWHLIGHLQSNKARKAGGAVRRDSFRRRRGPGRADRRGGRRVAAARSNCSFKSTWPARRPSTALRRTRCCRSSRQPNAAGRRSIAGLMLLPPAVDDPRRPGPYFARAAAAARRAACGKASASRRCTSCRWA